MPIIAGRASAAVGAGFGAITTPRFELVGSYDAIFSTVIPSGGVGVLNIVGIPTTYQHLQLRVSSRLTSGTVNNYLWYRFNGDATTSYSLHQFLSFGVSVSGAYNGTADIGYIERSAGGGAPTGVFGAIIMDIYDYNSNKNKVVKSFGGVETNQNNTNSQVYFNSNLHTRPEAVQRIDLAQETGNFAENTVISLYGVR